MITTDTTQLMVSNAYKSNPEQDLVTSKDRRKEKDFVTWAFPDIIDLQWKK